MRSTIIARARAGGMIAIGLASATTAILLADFVAPSLVVLASEQPGEGRDSRPAFTSTAGRAISIVCAVSDGSIIEACEEDPLRIDILLDAPSVASAPIFLVSVSGDSYGALSASIESSEAAGSAIAQEVSDHFPAIDDAHLVAVPEPSTFALVLGGLVALAVRRSRGLDSVRP